MVIDALKPLLESGLINEATREAITEAWENKVQELKSELRVEIREEFADRYDHDKKVMVKTLDRMVNEQLTEEIQKLKAEKIEVAKLKVNAVKEMKNAASKFNNFATRALAEELAEFAQERKLSKAHADKLEQFVMTSLAEEITEFAQDKQAVRETRVRLIAEAKTQLESLKAKFVTRSSAAVSKIVAETLNHEITQLHTDIKKARQNNFGRKIFEAFATEFTGTHLSENGEVRKLREELAATKNKLAESTKVVSTKEKLVESTQRKLKLVQDRSQRNNVLGELLSPLDRNKREVMSQLLETVQTGQLRSAYDKYLPAVLNNRSTSTVKSAEREMLHEATGNKEVKKVVPMDTDSLGDIKRLAGLQ